MTETTALAPLVEANPGIVLLDGEKFDRFYEEMKRETDAHVPDLATEKGRKAIASLAFKVARTKTAIDEAGKALNAEARSKIDLVDAARRKIRDQLDALKSEVRKPLDDWEAAEEARIQRGKDLLAHIQGVGNGLIGPDPQPFAILFRELEEKIEPEIASHLGEYEQLARDAARAAREKLDEALARHQKEEADRAELEALRQAQAERDEKDRLAAEAKEAEEAKRIAEARAKEEAEQAAAAEKAKIEAAAKAAEDAARAEVEQKAKAEREATEKAHAEALAAEKKRADEAEAARLAERAKLEAENAQRAKETQEAADKLRREEEGKAAREKDRAHRGKIMGEAKAYLIELGLDEAIAKTVVLAIVAGSVPHVTLAF